MGARARYLAGVVLSLLPGCALFKPHVPAEMLRSRILPPVESPIDRLPTPREVPENEEAAFFERLEVPRCEPSQGEVSLDDAIALALRYSPRLELMADRVAQAQAGRTVAFAEFLPQAAMSYRPMNGTENYVVPTLPTKIGGFAFGTPAERVNVAELNVQWTLYEFGRRYGRYGQAVSQAEIAQLQFVRAKQTVAFNVTAAYFDVLEARAMRVIAAEAVKRAESVLRDARNFLNRGAGIRNDVLRAEVLLAEMKLALVKATTAEGVAIAALNQIIGINVSTSTRVVDRAAVPDFVLSAEQALQLAADNRQEFGVVLQAIRAAALGEGVAKADFLPRISVGGTGLHIHSNAANAQNLAVGGLNVEVPLFAGGRRLGQLREAQAEMRAAIAQGKEICDSIAFEVQSAYLLIDDARQRIVLARTAREGAAENLRVVRGLFARGDATPTDVVDAELAMVRAEQNEATARYDYQTALARLAYAVGN